MNDEIRDRLKGLDENWGQLRELATNRGQKLDESLAYQQFVANIEEEEAWITEKQHLLSGEDIGDTLAAVQVKPLGYHMSLGDISRMSEKTFFFSAKIINIFKYF